MHAPPLPVPCSLPRSPPHFFLLSCAGYFEAISPVCVQGLEGGRAESRSANLSGCVGGRGEAAERPCEQIANYGRRVKS